MKNTKRYLITLIQVVILIVVSAGLYFGYTGLVHPVSVYVFTQDIDSGIKITETMVKTVQVPKAALSTANYITSAKDLSGKVTTGKVYAGQYILKQNVVDSDKLSPFADSERVNDLRKVAIKATFDSAAGGTLQKGDIVDLLVTIKKDTQGREYETKTFLKDVLVYNVIDSDGNTYLYDETKYSDTNDNKKQSDDESAYSQTLSTVVLAVSPADAEIIVNNSKLGDVSIVSQFVE